MTARRATQAELAAAASKYSTAAGARQAPLAAPLTDAEVAQTGGYGVAITDVDMTPRPRYGESRERFEARMRSYGVELEVLRTDVRVRNRRAALRGVASDGSVFAVTGPMAAQFAAQFFTQCGCGWCGLRVQDPEVARREYDAHACAAERVGQDAVDRAIAETDRNVLVKRGRAVLQESKPDPDLRIETGTRPVIVAQEDQDDTEQRFALLEMDIKR